MTTKSAAIFFGVVFILVGLMGYFPNPIVGNTHDAVFHTDSVHNLVHLVSGILFLLFAFAAPARAGLFLKLFGLVYLALGVIGFVTIGDTGMTELLGFLPVNGADNYLHIGLGIAIFLSGLLPNARREVRSGYGART